MTTATIDEVQEAKAAATKLTIPLSQLQHALATVTLAVERKTTIPVLGSVKVEARDGYVDFSGTNLEMAVRFRATLPEAKETKAFLLPGLKLADSAKLLQGDAVSITCHDDRRATVKCGRSTTRLPLQGMANFPKITVSEGETGVEIDQAVAERLVRFTTFATTSKGGTALTGALMEVSGGKLSLVATNGHTLARYTVPTDAADRFSILLHMNLLHIVDKVIGSGDTPLVIDGDDQNVYVNLTGEAFSVALAHRKISAQFPNYKAIMPTKAALTAKVDAETMLGSLRRCGTFATDNAGAVKLTISPDSPMVLRAASQDTGETEELLDATISGEFERFVVGFNIDYLLNAFSRLKGEVEMRFSAANGSNAMMIVASPEEGETFEYVVMPMRV
jgi:DNA polymerase III beta subunit